MLNATWLETFTVLAETGHFTRAAARLNMTQPGVSQHLRKLEAQVGQPLIAQDGKAFALTEAGEAVRALGLSRRAEEQALKEAIETDDPDVGDVRIGCSGSFATLIYPRMIRLMRRAPDLVVQIEAAPQRTVLSGVLDGRFDLGVVAEDPGHPRMEARKLGQEELCLILPRDAEAGSITFDALERRGFIAHPDGYAYADDLFSLNFPEKFRGADRLRLRSYVNQIGQIPEPVAQGVGYTLLPRSGVDAYVRASQLMIAPLAHRKFHELWMVSRRNRPFSARLSRMADLLQDAADTLTPAP